MLVMTLIASTILAQTSEHLTFKGVPIDGTLKQFCTKLEQEGFTLVGTDNGVALLNGDFAGYKNCTVGVVTFGLKDVVCKVAVIFPECETWSTLSSNYFSLKEMLTEKYGKPSNCIEKFQTIFKPSDDNERMYEVKFDRCKYSADFETPYGTIQLSIDHNSVVSCFVALTYEDKINSASVRAKSMEDL
jgi:hypothetical protein